MITPWQKCLLRSNVHSDGKGTLNLREVGLSRDTLKKGDWIRLNVRLPSEPSRVFHVGGQVQVKGNRLFVKEGGENLPKPSAGKPIVLEYNRDSVVVGDEKKNNKLPSSLPPLARDYVYAVIDGERDYQDEKWNDETTTTGGKHTVPEFVLFMEHYLQEARRHLSTQASPDADLMGLDFVRKVTALGVVCMEQNGAVPRGDLILLTNDNAEQKLLGK